MKETDLVKEFSWNLRDFMEERDYSQGRLAYRSRISQSMISRYLSGSQMPSIKSVINLSIALNCNFEDLVPLDEMIE